MLPWPSADLRPEHIARIPTNGNLQDSAYSIYWWLQAQALALGQGLALVLCLTQHRKQGSPGILKWNFQWLRDEVLKIVLPVELVL
jgi:hypothetical protein